MHPEAICICFGVCFASCPSPRQTRFYHCSYIVSVAASRTASRLTRVRVFEANAVRAAMMRRNIRLRALMERDVHEV